MLRGPARGDDFSEMSWKNVPNQPEVVFWWLGSSTSIIWKIVVDRVSYTRPFEYERKTLVLPLLV